MQQIFQTLRKDTSSYFFPNCLVCKMYKTRDTENTSTKTSISIAYICLKIIIVLCIKRDIYQYSSFTQSSVGLHLAVCHETRIFKFNIHKIINIFQYIRKCKKTAHQTMRSPIYSIWKVMQVAIF